MKRGQLIIIILIILIILGLFIFFKKSVLLAPNSQTNVRIGVGNAKPAITNIDAIPAVVLLPAPNATTISFTFKARDANGADDLNDSTATASFTKTGETTRTDSNCVFLSQAGKSKTYQCNVNMQHYDSNGVWNATVNIQDQQLASATDIVVFTVNLLKDITITPTQIDFPTVAPEDINVLPTGNQTTTIRNRGNYQGTVDIISSDLIGETNPAESIPAANFTAAGSAGAATVCTTGTNLVSASAEPITSTFLPRGIDDGSSNIEDLSYCLTQVPDISAQFYSATISGGNAWTIQI